MRITIKETGFLMVGIIKRIAIRNTQGMPNLKEYLTEQEVKDLKSFIFYSSKVLGEGMQPTEYLTNLAQMQYLSDQVTQVKN